MAPHSSTIAILMSDNKTKDLTTPKGRRGHATPHMPVERAKCWWLLKIEPNVWASS